MTISRANFGVNEPRVFVGLVDVDPVAVDADLVTAGKDPVAVETDPMVVAIAPKEKHR